MRTAAAALFVFLAIPACAGEDGPSAADWVEGAMASSLADGPHFRRSAPLVDLGHAAVEPLTAIIRDPRRPAREKVLAAQALGQLKAVVAGAPLRALAAAKGTPPDLKAAAEESLYMLGETSAVDARVERLLAKYEATPFARESARERLAATYAATGRFALAARVLRPLVESTEDEQRKQYLAYTLACYECLEGNRDAGISAVKVALESSRVDLDWILRDGDLALLHGDPEFARLVASAREARGGGVPTPSPAEKSPEEEAYESFRRSYWGGDFETYLEANNHYWEGYQDWLEEEGRQPDPGSVAAWKGKKGPEPENPNPAWIERFREQLAGHQGTPLAVRIRGDLLAILGNERRGKEWVELFLEVLAKTPEDEMAGDLAGSAMHWAEETERKEEVITTLHAVLKAHPKTASGAGIRIALAEARQNTGDADGARKLYAEVLQVYPKAFEAEEAKGALYEMDNLKIGMQAPLFTAKDIRGKPVSLKALRGKVVVLDFWATWCGPCLGELPHVKRLAAEFGGRDDFALIGISLDSDGIALVDFLAEEEMVWPQVCGLLGFDEPLAELYNVRGIPDAYLIDREGRIVERGLRGEDLLETVRKALDGER